MDRFQLYIDGAFDDGAASFESLDPATGTPWALMPEARADQVNRAVEAAHRAFRTGAWPKLTATQRGKLLYRLADLVQAAAPPPRAIGNPRHRQDHPRNLGPDRLCGGLLSLLRWSGRQDRRRASAHRQARYGGLAAPRAGRRGRRHRAVEQPTLPVGGETRPGTGRRLHRRPESQRRRPRAPAGIRETRPRSRLPPPAS